MDTNDPPVPLPASETPTQTKQVFDQTRQDLQSHFAQAREATREAASEMQAAAASTAAAAREGYQALREDAATQCESYRRSLAFQIREQPLTSVALAALSGVVLGWMARR